MKNPRRFLLSIAFILAALISFSQARVQIIHNSADLAAAVVDVWLDDELLLDNFEFRTASPFIDAPAGVEFTIVIAEPGSQNPNDPLWSQNYNLTDGETYIMVAQGIISASGYDPIIPFDIAVFDQGREEAGLATQTDVLIQHSSTDAPTVDIYEVGIGAGLLVDDLSYGEFAGYLELDTKDYILELRDETGTTAIAAYKAPFQMMGLKGDAVTILASGFLDPSVNSNGPAFGLWMALATGGDLVELEVYDPKARVQVIHNSADAAAALVDVWLDDMLLLDDFAFRTASPFIDAPAESEFTLAIKGPDSQNPDDPIWSQNYTLTEGSTYIMVAEGIVSASGYEPNVPFDIAVYPMGREAANMMDKTDMLVHHGSTDAPTVDIYETGVGAGLLVDNLAYSEFSGYLELEPLDYIIEVRDSTGATTVASYSAPLQTLGLEGEAITVVASGFLTPGNNSGGPAFGLWVALAAGGELIELPEYQAVARVQVIHNSADAAAEVVDVWLDDVLLIDNFEFRTASPFVDAPAGQEFTIAIQGPDSQGPEDPIWSKNYTLEDGKTYILVANGIVSASGYDPATPFDISVYPQARETANIPTQTDLLMHHGSTDAPIIDIVEVGLGLGPLANNLAYGNFAGYVTLSPLNYLLEVRQQNGTTKIASFEAPLSVLGLGGEAITIVASGFLEPGNNSSGPAFGLWVALASGGELIELPPYNPMARLQVIHNSADEAAAVVDVWMNQTLLLDNFEFRTASAFVDAPADEAFTIAIKGPDSQDPFDPIWSQSYTLEEGETYILIAEGIVSATGYDPAIPFNIAVYDMGRELAGNADRTDVLVHHGSTDAPAVDIYETKMGVGLLVDDIMYSEFAGYLELMTMNYILEVRDETGTNVVGAYRAYLQNLGLMGEAITIVASGFLDPMNNSDGPAFGLWVALADGGPLLELPLYAPIARVQVIHNSADAAAAVVDVWLDQTLLLDNFAFRSASPFIDAPAGSAFTIAIKGPDSQGPNDPIWSHQYTLTEDEKYILVANGIVSASGYDPASPFDVYVYTGAREMALSGTNTDVMVFHGATDAPTVDVVEVGAGAGTIVDNISYAEFDGYLELPTANYSLDIRDAAGTTTVANFAAPLADLNLQGEVVTLLASGFLVPDNNSNGEPFGLLAVLADGTAVMLTNTTGVEESPVISESINLFPNPAFEQVNVIFDLKENNRITLEVMDLAGRTMKSSDLGVRNQGIVIEQISVEDLSSGMYLLNIRTESAVISKKLLVR